MAMSYIDYRIKHRQHQKERGEEKPAAPAVGRQAGKSSPASSDGKKTNPGTSFIDYKINNRKEQVKQNGYERYGTYTASPQTAAQGPQATQMAAPMSQDNPYMKAAVRQMLPAYQRPVDPITVAAANMLRNNAKGNIDLYNRPQYRQPDGSISTVNSISIGTDEGAIPSVNGKGMEVLIPTIGRDKNGRPVQWTDEQAIENYRKTGENLGKFNSIEDADRYAEKLHQQQEAYYSPENSPLRLNNMAPKPYKLGDAVKRFESGASTYKDDPDADRYIEQSIRTSKNPFVNSSIGTPTIDPQTGDVTYSAEHGRNNWLDNYNVRENMNSDEARKARQDALNTLIAYGKGDDRTGYESTVLRNMTEDEQREYSYRLGKYGREEAEKYLDQIGERVTNRRAAEIVENVNRDVVSDDGSTPTTYVNPRTGEVIENARSGKNPINTLARAGKMGKLAAQSGLDMFASGVGDKFTNYVTGGTEITPATAEARASQAIKEQLSGPGRVAYDVVENSAMMAPTMAATAAAALAMPPLAPQIASVGVPSLGAAASAKAAADAAQIFGIGATMFPMSAGQAYEEALQKGMTPDQARFYGTLEGLNQAAGEYLLGGFEDLSGGYAKRAVDNVLGNVVADETKSQAAQTVARAIQHFLTTPEGRMAFSMGSEAFEEIVQGSVSNALNNAFFGENNGPVSQEDLYSGLIAALSAGMSNARYYARGYANGIGRVYSAEDIRAAADNIITDRAAYVNQEAYDAAMEQRDQMLAQADYVEQGGNLTPLEKSELGDAAGGALAEMDRIGRRARNESDIKEVADTLKTAQEIAQTEETKQEVEKISTRANDIIKRRAEGAQVTDAEVGRLINDTIRTTLTAGNEKAAATAEARTRMGFGEQGNTVMESSQATGQKAEALTALYEEARYDIKRNDAQKQLASTLLSEQELSAMYQAGIQDRNAFYNTDYSDKIGKIAEKYRPGNIKRGNVTYDGVDMDALQKAGDNESRAKYAQMKTIEHFLAGTLGYNVEWFESKTADGKYEGENGSYNRAKHLIRLDINAGAEVIGDKVKFASVIAHELTHTIEDGSPMQYQKIANTVMKALVADQEYSRGRNAEQIVADMIENNPYVKNEADAIHELVAQACEDMMNGNADIRAMFESMDESERNTIFDHISNIFAAIKNFFDDLLNSDSARSNRTEAAAIRRAKENIESLEKEWTEGVKRAAAYNAAAYEESQRIAAETEAADAEYAEDHNSQMDQFSVRQFAEAFGFELKYEKFTETDANGEEVTRYYKLYDPVTKKPVKRVTAKMMDKTPMGTLVNAALAAGSIDEKVAAKQKKMFADLMNLTIQYDNLPMVWEIAGAQLFSAIKSNSDAQYGSTVDFGTVCAKTQAIVDTMSRVMVEKGRGLTRAEVIKVYNEVANNGLSVPCPVCYVFSRWMGVPSLLENMRKCQERFSNMSNEEINEYVHSMEEKYGQDTSEKEDGKKKKPSALINEEKTRVQNRVRAAEEELRQARINKQGVEEALKNVEDLQNELNDLEAYNWVTQVLCKTNRKREAIRDAQGNVTKDTKYKAVPTEILLDLTRTGEFADPKNGYSKSWAFRTTRGAGMGKAILPYSGATIGDTVRGAGSSSPTRYNAKGNPFLNMLLTFDKKGNAHGNAIKDIRAAIKRIKAQNLIGGQRFQSTSDFRAEWGIDYLMTFLEAQAIGAKGQLYTKVIEAVDMFASAGIEVNLSIMGKGNGYHMENGKPVLGVEDFSSVTGIDFSKALEKTKKYSNVQMILVGLNDTHIRLALADDRITFIIPWHSSGSNEATLKSLMSGLNETLENGTDYSDTQSDGIIPKEQDPEYEKHQKMRNLRKAIVTGQFYEKSKNAKSKTRYLTEEEKQLLNENAYLNNLYNMYYVDETSDAYGVKLSGTQAMTSKGVPILFPYEYWDKTSTIKNADVNGQRFQDYCASLGMIPRFSGFVKDGVTYGNFTKDKGYWKLLIDRRMYDLKGKYHAPSVIDVTNVKVGSVPTSVNSNNYKDSESIDAAVRDSLMAIDNVGNEMTVTGEQMSNRDSSGRELTEQQAEYFKDSKARDENGNLLTLYHGTGSSGFTKFRVKPERGVWLTTSKRDADSYAGNFEGKLFDPNEAKSKGQSVGGSVRIGKHLRFENKADMEQFLNENPDANEYLSDRELLDKRYALDDLDWDELDEAEDEYNRLKRINRSVFGAYERYEMTHSQKIPLSEMLDHPERYSLDDVKRAWYTYDRNADLSDEFDYSSDDEFKQVLIDGLKDVIEERAEENGPEWREDMLSMKVSARIPEGMSGEIATRTNRTYALYANVVNPYVFDNEGRGSEGNGRFYHTIEKAMADPQYDGVIVKNARVGRYQDLGTVVLVKNPNQVKLTSNLNPTENEDIRFSSRNSTGNVSREVVDQVTDDSVTAMIDNGYTEKEAAEAVEVGGFVRYSTRTAPAPKKTITAYKAFYAVDGKLYPPMVANDVEEEQNNDKKKSKKKGKKKVSGTLNGMETPVGIWIDADVGALAYDDDGKPLRNTKGRLAVKNAKGGGTLAFRPGWHLGLWPDAKQFNVKDPVTGKIKACMPDGLVFARCSVAADNDYQLEALGYGMGSNGKFNRTQAGLPRIPVDGYYMYRTNALPDTAPWIISGAIRVEEILDDDMAAEICKQYGITADPRASHNKINLADYGLKAGPVTPTEDTDRFLPNNAVKANAAALEEALNDPAYANAYAANSVNFDDPEIVKELARNGQSAEFYKAAQEKYGNKSYAVDNPNDSLINKNTFAVGSGNSQYSSRSMAELEAEYQEALDAKNEDWQLMLVDQAAYNAGYTVGAYHGSPFENIHIFNTRSQETKKTKMQLLFGTHFTHNLEYAKLYARKAKNSKGTSRMTSKEGQIYKTYLNLGKSLDLRTARNITPGMEEYRLYEDAPAKYQRHFKPYTFSKYDTEQGLGSGQYITAATIESVLQAMSPKEATDFLVDHGYNSILYDADYATPTSGNNRFTRDPSIIMLDPERIKSGDPVTYDDNGNVIPLSERFNPANEDIRYSSRDTGNAPTFYSKLQREIQNYKGEKIGAASVESYLKGKGVKDEEIKWSGIRTFLEGKKSVNKQELMDFLKANEMQIKEKVLSDEADIGEWSNGYNTVNVNYFYDPVSGAEFKDEESFRKEALKKAAEDHYDKSELIFNISDDYMSVESEDGDVIFEAYPPDTYELRDSDYSPVNGTKWESYKLDGGKNYREILFSIAGSDYINGPMRTHWKGETGVLAHARVQDFDSADGGKVLFIEEIQSDWHNEGQKYGYKTAENNDISEEKADVRFEDGVYKLYVDGEDTKSFFSPEYMERAGIDKKDVKKALIDDYRKALRLQGLDDTAPDAPFRTTYTDYVLKNLLRMAAEGDYDYLAWTTSEMQMDRWNPERLPTNKMTGSGSSDDVAFEEGYRIEYDQQIPKFLKKYGKQWGAGLQNVKIYGGWDRAGNAPYVPAITVNELMKETVLTEGQPMFSARSNGFDQRTSFGTVEELERRNENIWHINYTLDQVLRDRGAQTQKVSDHQIKRIANRYIREYNSKADADTIAEGLKAMYEYIDYGAKISAQQVGKIATAYAEQIIDESKDVDDTMAAMYPGLADDIKRTKLYVSPEAMKEMAYYFDGAADFRRQAKKFLTISERPGDGRGIDTFYEELSESYPELFDPDVANEKDQFLQIFDVAEQLKAKTIDKDWGSEYDEVAYTLGQDLVAAYFAEKGDSSYKRSIDQIKVQMAKDHKEQMANLRRYKDQQIKEIKDKLTGERRMNTAQIAELRARLQEQYRQREEKASLRRLTTQAKAKLQRQARQLWSKRGTPEFERLKAKLFSELDLVSVGITKGGRLSLERAYNEARKQAALDPDYAASADYENIKLKFQGDLANPSVERKHLRDLSYDEIVDLTQDIIALKHSQQTYDKVIKENYEAKVADYGRRGVAQQGRVKGILNQKGRRAIMLAAVKKYALYMENPVRAAHLLDGYQEGGVLTELFDDINDGTTKKTRFQQQANQMFEEILKDKKLTDGWSDQNIEINVGAGKYYISKGMRISIALHARNDDNIRHVGYGGFSIPNERLYKAGRYTDAYNAGVTVKMTEEEMKQIASEMTPEEKKFANIAYKFFNHTTKDAINETSMVLKGYELALVPNYMPIRTDPNFTQAEIDGLIHDGTIEGKGQFKDRKPGAGNPILLEDIAQVIERQTQTTAAYYGLAIPVRNMNKVWKYTATAYKASLKKAIAENWGQLGKDTIEKMLKDIQAGARRGDTGDHVFSFLKGAQAASTLTMNVGVSMKQFASYPLAISMLDADCLMKGLRAKTDRAYIDSITPWSWDRRHGMGGEEMGDIFKQKGMIARNENIQKIKNMVNWIQAVDVFTTDHLFAACEAQVQKDNPDLEVRGKEYNEKVAALYNDVLWRTQPSYGVMQRNELMRSASTIMKALTMYKTQTFNMGGEIIDAGLRAITMKDMAKDGLVSNDEAKKATQDLKKVLWGTVLSQATLAALSAIAAAALRKMRPYRDDKGEITAGSLMQKVGTDFITSWFGLFFGADLAEQAVGSVLNFAQWYDVTAPQLDGLNDTVNDMSAWSTALGDYIEETDTDKKAEKKAKLVKTSAKMAMTTAGTFGVPTTNVYNMLNALNLLSRDVSEGNGFLSFEAGEGLLGLTDTSPTKEQYARQAVYYSEREEPDKVAHALQGTNKANLEKVLGMKLTKNLYDSFMNDPENLAKYMNVKQGVSAPKPSDVPDEGYASFTKLREAIGDPERTQNWHHIVEQEQGPGNGNFGNFSAMQINNKNNIVSIPAGAKSPHSAISKYYDSVQDFTGGKTVREWLSTKSFGEQFDFGVKQLQKYGDIIPTSNGWVFVPDDQKIEAAMPLEKGKADVRTDTQKQWETRMAELREDGGLTGREVRDAALTMLKDGLTADEAIELYRSNQKSDKNLDKWKGSFEDYLNGRNAIDDAKAIKDSDKKRQKEKRKDAVEDYLRKYKGTREDELLLWKLAGYGESTFEYH